MPTEFAARAGQKKSVAPGWLSQAPERVAELGYRGLMRGQRVVIPGLGNRLISILIRVLPRRTLLAMVDFAASAAQVRAGDITSEAAHIANADKPLVLDAREMRRTAMLKPVLIILHQEHSSPGRVGQMLTKLGYPLDIRRPRFGDPLPETIDEHAGGVIFGGPQSANDNEDFVRREIDWIGVPLRDNKPYLGICLGAQMMTRHLGSRVYPHPQGHAEVGYIRSARPRRGLGLRRMAGPCLPMASRGLRAAGRRRIAGRG